MPREIDVMLARQRKSDAVLLEQTMNQLVIPIGFEYVQFSWDRLPEVLRRGECLVKPAPMFDVAVAPAPAARAAESRAMEEDVERWDGLS